MRPATWCYAYLLLLDGTTALATPNKIAQNSPGAPTGVPAGTKPVASSNGQRFREDVFSTAPYINRETALVQYGFPGILVGATGVLMTSAVRRLILWANARDQPPTSTPSTPPGSSWSWRDQLKNLAPLRDGEDARVVVDAYLPNPADRLRWLECMNDQLTRLWGISSAETVVGDYLSNRVHPEQQDDINPLVPFCIHQVLTALADAQARRAQNPGETVGDTPATDTPGTSGNPRPDPPPDRRRPRNRAEDDRDNPLLHQVKQGAGRLAAGAAGINLNQVATNAGKAMSGAAGALVRQPLPPVRMPKPLVAAVP